MEKIMVLNLQVGSEVGIARFVRGYPVTAKFGIVESINGYGHITVKLDDMVIKFDKRGNSYKSSYGPDLIEADQLRVIMAREAARKACNDVARDIEETMKNGWSYSTFHVTSERVAELKRLVALLEETM